MFRSGNDYENFHEKYNGNFNAWLYLKPNFYFINFMILKINIECNHL